MGTDIHGWIEIFTEETGWEGVVWIDPFVGRNYDMFGCLFGVCNYASFAPIAFNRGLSADVSTEVTKHALGYDPIDYPSWVIWEEIKAIRWDEPAVEPDKRLHEYKRNAAGEWRLVRKDAKYYLLTSISMDMTIERSWEENGILYKIETIKREDVLSHDWKMLFQMMEYLNQEHQPNRIRLVVWFDS